MWLQEDALLSTCISALSPLSHPPHLCKCVLFHCCVSLHKNSTTSWVRQMFNCRATATPQVASIHLSACVTAGSHSWTATIYLDEENRSRAIKMVCGKGCAKQNMAMAIACLAAISQEKTTSQLWDRRDFMSRNGKYVSTPALKCK